MLPSSGLAWAIPTWRGCDEIPWPSGDGHELGDAEPRRLRWAEAAAHRREEGGAPRPDDARPGAAAARAAAPEREE
eukprot:8839786-Pyramimonas_sp.AAC.1